MNNATRQTIINHVLEQYALTSLHQGTTIINSYAFLSLQGTINVDQLLTSPHLRRAAEKVGTVETLFAGEELSVTTSEHHLLSVSSAWNDAAEMARIHMMHASEDITRLLHDVTLQHASPAELHQLLRHLSEPQATLDSSSPRSVRLARARLLGTPAAAEDPGF